MSKRMYGIVLAIEADDETAAFEGVTDALTDGEREIALAFASNPTRITRTPDDYDGDTIAREVIDNPRAITTEGEFGEIEYTPFPADHEDGHTLFEFVHGALIEDAEGRLFNVVGWGPVQGSVEVVDDDEIHAYLDGSQRFRLHEREDDDAALLPCGCTAGDGGTFCQRCRPETGGTESERGQLAEAGWTHVADMTDHQVRLVYEAEGDRNHEQVSGERKVWEHALPEAGGMSTSDGLGTDSTPQEAGWLDALQSAATTGSAADVAETAYRVLADAGRTIDAH